MLPRLIGVTRAADVLLSSRVVLAEEAEQLGLINRVLPPEELLSFTYDYAGRLATEIAPSSLAVTKLQLYRDLHGDVASSVRDASARMADMMQGRRLRRRCGRTDREAPARLRGPAAPRLSGIGQASTPAGSLAGSQPRSATAWRKAKRSVMPAT